MTISNTNHTVVDDRALLRNIIMDIKFYFFSFMEYNDHEIARQINNNLERKESPFRVLPSFVREVRCNNI